MSGETANLLLRDAATSDQTCRRTFSSSICPL